MQSAPVIIAFPLSFESVYFKAHIAAHYYLHFFLYVFRCFIHTTLQVRDIFLFQTPASKLTSREGVLP
jgi:hypothetical protein